MKRDLLIVAVSFALTATSLLATVLFTVEYFLVFPIAFTVFFGYTFASIKEYLRSKDEADEYKAVKFPTKYLAFGNGINVLICIGLTIMDFASGGIFMGLLAVLILIYIVPIIVGLYIIIFATNYIINHKK